MHKRAIVIGAGIVGLAHARALRLKGYKVTVVERSLEASGASIRNFGMVWPIGQPSGILHQRSVRSMAVWHELCTQAKIWYSQPGCLHVATTALEAEVMQQIAAHYAQERQTSWMTNHQLAKRSNAANLTNALGALYSPHETIVEAREAIRMLPRLLQEKLEIDFWWGKAATEVQPNKVKIGNTWYVAELVLVCSGVDFESLFPEQFADAPITRCKLQMMRLQLHAEAWHMGPAICGGLSLIHYKSFEVAPSLPLLKEHYRQSIPHYLQWGIHVMACQNQYGQITVGDTHEYGPNPDPFDRDDLNQWVLDYLQQFAQFPQPKVVQTWHGVYAKMTNGGTEYVAQVLPGVWVINGLGGAGMTLSFGLAEEVVATM